MSPNDPEPLGDDESLRRLRMFLRQLEALLAAVAEQPSPVMPRRVRESMTAAWVEVRPMFGTAVDHLSNVTDDQKNSLRAAGLLGPQLEFKLMVFEYRRDELLDHGTPREGQGKKRSWWRRFLDLFKPALKSADVLLGSLAKALPLSPFEAIKEYKEAAEAGAEVGWKAGK